jgi:hypothetical protein
MYSTHSAALALLIARSLSTADIRASVWPSRESSSPTQAQTQTPKAVSEKLPANTSNRDRIRFMVVLWRGERLPSQE